MDKGGVEHFAGLGSLSAVQVGVGEGSFNFGKHGKDRSSAAVGREFGLSGANRLLSLFNGSGTDGNGGETEPGGGQKPGVAGEFEGADMLPLQQERDPSARGGLLHLGEAADGSGETDCGIVSGVELANGGQVVAPGGFHVAGIDGGAGAHVTDAEFDEGVMVNLGQALRADEGGVVLNIGAGGGVAVCIQGLDQGLGPDEGGVDSLEGMDDVVAAGVVANSLQGIGLLDRGAVFSGRIGKTMEHLSGERGLRGGGRIIAVNLGID